MRTFVKKLLAVALCLVMVAGVVPVMSAKTWAASSPDTSGLTKIVSLDVTPYSQTQSYTCGYAATRTVLGYFGMALNHTDMSLFGNPTSPAPASSILSKLNESQYLGSGYYSYYPTSSNTWNRNEAVSKIRESLLSGNPSIIWLATQKKDESYVDRTYLFGTKGHYTTVTGMYKDASGKYYYMLKDSYLDNAHGYGSNYIDNNRNSSTATILIPETILITYMDRYGEVTGDVFYSTNNALANTLTCAGIPGVRSDQIGYMDTFMNYNIDNNSNLQTALNSGKSVIFMFEGGSSNFATPYVKDGGIRNQAIVFVVQKTSAGIAIVFSCNDCSSLPDHHLDGGGSPTLPDGIYQVKTTDHNGAYAALHVVNNGYGGINIHSRATNNGDWGWSAGCQLVGSGWKTGNEYNGFMKAVLKPYVDVQGYIWEEYASGSGGQAPSKMKKLSDFNLQSGLDVGYYVLNRCLARDSLVGDMYSQEKINEITSFSVNNAGSISSTAPTTPTEISGVWNYNSSTDKYDITITWKAVNGAAKYVVNYKTSSGSWEELDESKAAPGIATNTVTARGFSKTRDSADFQIIAVNSSGAASAPAEITIPKSAATYTVSYNANGGSGAPAAQTKTQDVALTLSSTKPTRAAASAGSYTVTLNANGGSVSSTSLSAARTTNYSFKNWNTASNGSGTAYSAGASYTANSPATLYAQWDAATTTSAVTLPTPSRAGYIFKGWAASESAASGTTGSYTPSGNVTLYAVWQEILPENLTASTDKNRYVLGETVTFIHSAQNATQFDVSVWKGTPSDETLVFYDGFYAPDRVSTYRPTGAEAAGTYNVTVRAKNAAGTTISTSFTFSVVRPTLTAQANSDGTVTLRIDCSDPDAGWYWAVFRSTDQSFTDAQRLYGVSGAESSWTDTTAAPGTVYYYKVQPLASDGSWAGGYSNAVYVSTPACYLDLNALIDGELATVLDGCATADVYINGTLVADACSDYCGAWTAGTSYKISDIKPVAGYQFDGLSNLSLYTGTDTQAVPGALSGTLSETLTEVVLVFSKAPVSVPVSAVSLNQSELSLNVGDSAALTAVVSPSDAANKAVAWSSSNTSVATVDGGSIRAVAPGNAIITVTTEDGGFTATCSVTVSAPAPAPGNTPLSLTARYNRSTLTATVSVLTTEAITLSNYDLTLTGGAAFTLTGIENGQPDRMKNFQSSVSAGSIAAMSAGDNVTIPAGETLAVYTFTTTEKLESGDYPFALSVQDVSDMDAEPLSWKGCTVAGTLTVLPLSEESFDLHGSGAYTLNFESPAAGDFTLTAEKPCIVLYSNGTKLQKLAATPVSGSTYAFTLPADWDDSTKLTVALKADFTGDGDITSTDALQVLRCAAGNRSFSELHVLIADINNDGVLTSTDALQILRVCVGLRSLSW